MVAVVRSEVIVCVVCANCAPTTLMFSVEEEENEAPAAFVAGKFVSVP